MFRDEIVNINNNETIIPHLTPSSTLKFIKSFISKTVNTILPGDDTDLLDKDTASHIIFLKKILLPSVLESLVVMSIAGAASPFLNPNINWYENPLFTSAIFMIFNFLFRIPSAYTNKEILQKMIHWSHIPDDIFRRIIHMIRSIMFGFSTQTASSLIHEGGHALMALSLFKNASPKITINGALFNSGGLTHYNYQSGLTDAGKRLGVENSHIVITAMGTGALVLSSGLCMIGAQAASDNFPEIRSHLRMFVFFSLIIDLYYAFSAYGDCSDRAHDFCKLKNAGYSPMIFISIILGFTLLLQLGLTGLNFGLNRLRQKETKPQEEDTYELLQHSSSHSEEDLEESWQSSDNIESSNVVYYRS